MNYNVNHNFFVSKIHEMNICGKQMFSLEGSVFTAPYEIQKLDYKKHNLESCEGCRKNYLVVLDDINKQHKTFPNCCDYHKKLINQKWFKTSEFELVPKMYADKLFNSWHHILQFIEEDNWEDEILNFLEHVFLSFGSFPKDYGEPLYFGSFKERLKKLLKSLKLLPIRKQVILEYIENYGSSKKDKKKEKSDLNVLLTIYDKWFKLFPFELNYFKDIKEKYAKHIPIVESQEYNKYVGLTKITTISKSKLINHLIELTNKIIIETNAETIIARGLKINYDETKLDLVRQKRKQKLKVGYTNNSKNEDAKYRKILKEWLKDEIKFINEITPIFKSKVSVLDNILYACSKMQENKHFWNADEDTKTKQVLDLLESKYVVKDQSKQGESSVGKNAGSIDGILIADGNEIFIEALILAYLNKNQVKNHINKLERNYDAKGLREKFVIIYCHIEDNMFGVFCKNYIDYLDNDNLFEFCKIDSTIEIEAPYLNTKIFRTTHLREENKVNLIHILLKFPKNKKN